MRVSTAAREVVERDLELKVAVTTVYLDPPGTILARSAQRRGSREQARLLPGAVDAVQRLCDEDYEVVVLSDRPIAPLAGLGSVRFDAQPPAEDADADAVKRRNGPTPRSWLIAADETWSDWTRPAGLRTVRVGPRLPDSHRPTSRFDVEARDLNAAVLEILVQDTLET